MVYKRLHELTPSTRGSQETGFTQLLTEKYALHSISLTHGRDPIPKKGKTILKLIFDHDLSISCLKPQSPSNLVSAMAISGL